MKIQRYVTMDKETRQKFIDDPAVLYLYNVSPEVYGLEGDEQYIIITESGSYDELPKGMLIFSMQEWFRKIERCELLPWICACLNRKYVIKEAVKLLMATEPLKLRVNLQVMPLDRLPRWQLIANCLLTRQILENHKIVNFKEVRKYLPADIDTMKFGTFFDEHLSPLYHEVMAMTDGIAEKQEKDRIKKLTNGNV